MRKPREPNKPIKPAKTIEKWVPYKNIIIEFDTEISFYDLMKCIPVDSNLNFYKMRISYA